MSETARKTGNQAFTIPDGPMSRSVFDAAMRIKETVSRIIDHPGVVEDLTSASNVLIAESERIAALETATPVVIIGVPTNRKIN